jgi:hypothetical protein
MRHRQDSCPLPCPRYTSCTGRNPRYDRLFSYELQQLQTVSFTYKSVYTAAKGALPALANHPPVTLNFKEGSKHVSGPVPKWDPSATAVLTRWAKEILDSGLYTLSKSPSASRPHIVRKTPPDAPKDVDIRQCGIRVCGDYRMPNDQLQKSFPSTANGTDELSKLPGYSLYWCTDRFSMYNAYLLEPGPSRELLAVHIPLDLIEPTRMVFGEMNAGPVACAAPPRYPSNPPGLCSPSHRVVRGRSCARRSFFCRPAKRKLDVERHQNSRRFSLLRFLRLHGRQDRHSPRRQKPRPHQAHSSPHKLTGVAHDPGRFRLVIAFHPLLCVRRSFARSPSSLAATKASPFLLYGQQNGNKVMTTSVSYCLMASTLPLPTTAYLFTAEVTHPLIDGKAYGIHQFCDLLRGTQYSVTAHSPTETTVRLTETNALHTIPHTSATRLNVAWFSKTWSKADRKRALFYLETDTLLWGLAKCRFWALSSPFPLYASSDHLPQKWIRKCDTGPVSEFTIEQLSDLQWIHSYTLSSVLVFSPLWDCLTLSRISSTLFPIPLKTLSTPACLLPRIPRKSPNKSKHGAVPLTLSTSTLLPTARHWPPLPASSSLSLALRTPPGSRPAF